MFATRKRRGTTDGPGARRELSTTLRVALPPRFEAVGEALASGSDPVAACEVAGAALAGDGVSLAEALDQLAVTSHAVTGGEPAHQATRAVAVAWSDATLAYVNTLSCDDPLTGLSSLAHLRSRTAELYRAEAHVGTPPALSHALVVVSTPLPSGTAPGRDGALTQALHVASVGDTARTVFAGSETVASAGSGRVVVLADRDDRLGRRVALLRRMLDGRPAGPARVWIEGLPHSDEAAARLLDELTRT